MVYSSRRFVLYLTFVILFLCFSDLLTLRLPRLGKRELILVLFVRLFDLRLFGFVCFLFLLVSRKGCGLPLDFSMQTAYDILYITYITYRFIKPLCLVRVYTVKARLFEKSTAIIAWQWSLNNKNKSVTHLIHKQIYNGCCISLN